MTTSTPKKGTRTPRNWQETFLKSLAQYGNVSYAARAAKVSRNFVYGQREAYPDVATRWDAALDEAADVLEKEAWRRAAKGVKKEKTIYYLGLPIGTQIETTYSDPLLMFLLKAARPEKFRDRLDINQKSKVDITLTADDMAELDRQAEVELKAFEAETSGDV